MKTIVIILIILVNFIGGKSLGTYDPGTGKVDESVIVQASIQGKYTNLLHVIEAPGDKVRYGAYCDWGYWYGFEYEGHTDLTPGFWVYMYPKWYIWGKLSAEESADGDASVHGKYTMLMHVLHVPEDAGMYGGFYDWGFSEEYSYAGYDNLTPGYWVYSEPNWYVWADVTNNTGGT